MQLKFLSRGKKLEKQIKPPNIDTAFNLIHVSTAISKLLLSFVQDTYTQFSSEWKSER